MIVARVPLPSGVPAPRRNEQQNSVARAPPTVLQAAITGESEEDRLASALSGAKAQWGPSSFVPAKRARRQGCFNCQAPNHRQDECPLTNIKKTTHGIPKSKLEYVSADTPDAMLTPDGKFALIKQPL